MANTKGHSRPKERESRPAGTERLPENRRLGSDVSEYTHDARGDQFGAPFNSARAAALAVLQHAQNLTRKAGSFLGQTVADDTPLSAAQRDWLDALLSRAGLPPLVDGGADA